MKYILSFSGGKDSTYLLLELIRRGCPLDEVVFFDTGWEYDVMYDHINRCAQICEDHGIKFISLHPDHTFDYYMFEHITRSGKHGYSWCGGPCRWGTRCKIQTINRYIRQAGRCIVYVGIAADEPERLDREREYYKRFPLVDWRITEAECLQGCYDAGFDWGGMYEHLDRVSCKYCANKNLKELRNVRTYYPKVWDELKDYQSRTNRPYKGEQQSVFDIEERFRLEDEIREEGRIITRREFFEELRERLDMRRECFDDEFILDMRYVWSTCWGTDDYRFGTDETLMCSETIDGGDVIQTSPYSMNYRDWVRLN